MQGAKEVRRRQGMPTEAASQAVRTSLFVRHDGERGTKRMVDIF